MSDLGLGIKYTHQWRYSYDYWPAMASTQLTIGSITISLTTSPSNLFAAIAAKEFTVAGQTFTANPSSFAIAGTTILADGPAVTISGTIVSLGRSEALKIGSSTISLPTSAPSKVYTVAGQTFTLNPTAFPIAGTTVSAGGPAVTVGGTIISLQPSGIMIVGSSTIPLLTPQATLLSDVNIDGFDVKAQSSFVVVDGVTVSAAAAGVTVSGNVISLESGGASLDIGSSRFALPTAMVAKNGSVDVQAFVGGQGKGMEVSLFLVCGVCGVDAADMTVMVVSVGIVRDFFFSPLKARRGRSVRMKREDGRSKHTVRALERHLGRPGSANRAR